MEKVMMYKGLEVSATNTGNDDIAKIYVNDEFVADFYRYEHGDGRVVYYLSAGATDYPEGTFESPMKAIKEYLDRCYLPLEERPVPIEELLEY